MNKIYIYLFLIIAFLGCKEEKKTSENPVENEINEKNESDSFFTLKINAKIEKDDNLILFYLEEDQDNISKKNSIELPVVGKDNFQNLTFKVNRDVLPTRLILKFGNEEKSQTIVMNEVKISYHENDISISKENFFSFFNPNKFIEYDKTTYTAIATEKDGVFNPFFVSRKTLEDKIYLELP
jgi:hypothetical protein